MSDVDVSAEVARALAGWTPQREHVREQAIGEARKLIASKLGELERVDFEALFEHFHADFREGRVTGDRFSRAFVGSLHHKLLGNISALNRWTERLWLARTDAEVAVALDELWAVSKSELPGAGRSYPTVLLYTRSPERYWPWFGTGIPEGYARLRGAGVNRRSGKAYIEFVEWVRRWRDQYDVPTHAVDLVLSVVGRANAEATPEPPTPDPPTHTTKPIELCLELRLLGDKRSCKVRRAGADAWPETGALLPPLNDCAEIVKAADPARIESLGRQLFGALLRDSALASTYEQLRADAEQAGAPLRLVLRMCPDEDDPEQCSVALHYWEALVDPKRGPLAIDLRVRLVRSLATLDSIAPPPPSVPLRVNVGLADPIDLDALHLTQEWARFHQLQADASKSEVLALTVHPSLDIDTLAGFIHQTDVFHFAGHGEQGRLMLEGPARMSRPLDAEALRGLLTSPVPALVVLNACLGSVGDGRRISVAEAFAARRVPVVVAMNDEVADRSALIFGEELHQRIAAGVDVELAVQRARWRAFAERAHSWFIPVLWSQTSTSFVLIDPAQARADPVVQGQLDRLDRHAEELAPRARVLQRLIVERVDAAHRDELADALLAEVAVDGNTDERQLERVLDDANERERLLDPIRRRAADPSAELREVATTLRRELVPQLGAAANVLPELISALHTVLDRPTDTSGPPTLADYSLDDSAPLRLGPDTNIAELVAAIFEDTKLLLDEEIVTRCLVHLLAGRHLVLAGPPGTGKSTLAKALARAFGYASPVATANPDWTTFDTIGGLAPVSVHDAHGRAHLSYPFRPGCVLDAVEANWTGETRTWLVIDEMNRAPLDQAFGELFTALVDHELKDPRRTKPLPIPKDFRLICTTNTADRRLLFEFSEALKRRFAFVEIPAFGGNARGLGDRDKLLDQLRTRDALDGLDIEGPFNTIVDELEAIIARIRVLFPLGLAQVLDVTTYVIVGAHYQAESPAKLMETALIDNVLPLLESQPPALLEALADLLDGADRIKLWIETFLDPQTSYRPEPGHARIAAELLAGLANHEVPHEAVVDWAAQFAEGRAETIAAAAPKIDRAEQLARALRRVAAERHG